MYHFNGTAWVLVSPPSSRNQGMTFHGINSMNVAQCSSDTNTATTSKGHGIFIFRDDKEQLQQQYKNIRRAPLKQLFPRTPTPFKKAYAAAVQKGGQVEQLDLQKSPELFEDLQEIILKDVILPPPKRSRRTLQYESLEHSAGTSSRTSYCTPYNDRILDTTITPSKVLKDPAFLMSPPLKGAMSVCGETSSSSNACGETAFVEPRNPPPPMSEEWIRLTCGLTPAQVEMTEMAKRILDRRQFQGPFQ